MRAVLMSMKPQWWEKILAGEKLLEIRKSAPKGGAGEPEPWPLLVLVYVSGTGAVQGQFSCEGWVKTNYLQFLERLSCVPLEDLEKYAGGPGKKLCGWVIKSAEKFDTPSPLAEFGLDRPPMSWQLLCAAARPQPCALGGLCRGAAQGLPPPCLGPPWDFERCGARKARNFCP